MHYARRNGNLYPTHGLGPIAQYMGINQGDRFDYLSSVSSPALGRPLYAKERFPADHKWNQIKGWRCGDINTTIIKTVKGRSIMVQWDETSPRPYSRHNLIQGTRGTFAGVPESYRLDYRKEDCRTGAQGLWAISPARIITGGIKTWHRGSKPMTIRSGSVWVPRRNGLVDTAAWTSS